MLGFLDGKKTYVIALIMALTGAAKLVGIDVPAFDDQSGGALLANGLAFLFLRKGLKG